MLNVEKNLQGDVLAVTLSGTIDENANFQTLLEPLPKVLQLNLRKVTRINSVGVKAWIRYFKEVQTKGTQVMLVECSPQIVEQINQISNFTCGAQIHSILVPFLCGQCRSELLGAFKLADLKAMNGVFPTPQCPKCQGKAEFDDIPEEYLAFLEREG
jgi:anti-anti-sigma regulatory factor